MCLHSAIELDAAVGCYALNVLVARAHTVPAYLGTDEERLSFLSSVLVGYSARDLGVGATTGVRPEGKLAVGTVAAAVAVRKLAPTDRTRFWGARWPVIEVGDPFAHFLVFRRAHR